MKLKKLSLILTGLMIAVCAVSCGGETQPIKDTPETAGTPVQEPALTEGAETAAAPSAQKGYTCVLDNGASITIGAGAADVIAALGTYSDYMEAPSCIHEGFDKVYTYGGAYTVTTSPAADGSEYVAEVSLLSDAVALKMDKKDIMIGDNAADIISAVGEPDVNNFGVMYFNLEGGVLILQVDDDGAVSAITVTQAAG